MPVCIRLEDVFATGNHFRLRVTVTDCILPDDPVGGVFYKKDPEGFDKYLDGAQAVLKESGKVEIHVTWRRGDFTDQNHSLPPDKTVINSWKTVIWKDVPWNGTPIVRECDMVCRQGEILSPKIEGDVYTYTNAGDLKQLYTANLFRFNCS